MAWYNFWKSDWRLVKTIAVNVNFNRQDCKIYLHLLESNKGKRQLKSAITIRLDSYQNLDEIVELLDVYQTKVYRWLNGRYDPDIPRYNDIPAEETANALKGQI